jgi:hypothetical protein
MCEASNEEVSYSERMTVKLSLSTLLGYYTSGGCLCAMEDHFTCNKRKKKKK